MAVAAAVVVAAAIAAIAAIAARTVVDVVHMAVVVAIPMAACSGTAAAAHSAAQEQVQVGGTQVEQELQQDSTQHPSKRSQVFARSVPLAQ